MKTEILKQIEEQFCKIKLDDETKIYESHLGTQGLIRRYVSGKRENDAGSLIQENRDAANERISKQQYSIAETDLQIKIILENAGFNCIIKESVTLLGKTIDIIIDKFLFNGKLTENSRYTGE